MSTDKEKNGTKPQRSSVKGRSSKPKNVVKNASRSRSAADPKRAYASSSKRTVSKTGQVSDVTPRAQLPKGLRVVLRIAAVVVLLILVVSVWTNSTGWSFNDTVDNIKLSIKDSRALGSKKVDFPIPLGGTTSIKAEKLANGIAVLTDNALNVYNKNGSLASNSPHYMASPGMKAAGHYAVVYDIGGTRWRLETASGTVLTGKADGNITCCAPAACGRFAVACDDATRLSQVFVYDKEGNALFGWHSGDYYITSAAMSEDGEFLTVIGINASGGVVCSAVMVFNIEKNEQIFFKDLNDTMLLDLFYLKSGTAVVIGENTMLRISKGAYEMEEIKTGGRVLAFDFDRDSGVAVCSEGVDGNKLYAFDTKGMNRFEKEIATAVTDVCISDRHVCYLYHGEITAFDLKGKEESPVETAVDAKRLLVFKDNAYVLCNSVLRRVEIDD